MLYAYLNHRIDKFLNAVCNLKKLWTYETFRTFYQIFHSFGSESTKTLRNENRIPQCCLATNTNDRRGRFVVRFDEIWKAHRWRCRYHRIINSDCVEKMNNNMLSIFFYLDEQLLKRKKIVDKIPTIEN